MRTRSMVSVFFLGVALLAATELVAQSTKDPKPGPGKTPNPKETGNQSYNFPVVGEEPFADVKARDEGEKSKFAERQKALFAARYDMSNKPSPVKMSAGRKAVQAGVRVKLAEGTTWDDLAKMTPAEIREKGVFPAGFLPCPT